MGKLAFRHCGVAEVLFSFDVRIFQCVIRPF